MTSAYAAKVYFTPQKKSVRAQKIYSSPLTTYDMVSAKCLLQDNLEKVWSFKETFILVNTSIEIILEISFFYFSNIDIEFVELEKLTQRSYTAIEVVLTTNRVEVIDKENLLNWPWIKTRRLSSCMLRLWKLPRLPGWQFIFISSSANCFVVEQSFNRVDAWVL